MITVPGGANVPKHLRKGKKHKEKKKAPKKDTKLGRRNRTNDGVKKLGGPPKLDFPSSASDTFDVAAPIHDADAIISEPSDGWMTAATAPQFTLNPVIALSNNRSTAVKLYNSPRHQRADSVAEALFNTLFRCRRKQARTKMLEWDETDGEDDDEFVDEAWITSFLKDSVLASKAIDYALQDGTQSQLLEKYVDEGCVYSLVEHLRYEDPRITSARLTLIRAIFRSCTRLRTCVCMALTHSSRERAERCAWVDAVAEEMEMDSDHVAASETHPSVQRDKPQNNPHLSPNIPTTALVRDHPMAMLELVQFLLDELSTPLGSFSAKGAAPIFTPLPFPPPPMQPNTQPQSSSVPGRQRARSSADEDLSTAPRRTRSVGAIDSLKLKRKAPISMPMPLPIFTSMGMPIPMPVDTGMGNKSSMQTGAGNDPTFRDKCISRVQVVRTDTTSSDPGFAAAASAFDETMRTWRTCVFELHRTLLNVIRAYGTRLGCPNGPDSSELAETETCLRRLLGLAPYLGPYICRALLRSWPSGISSRVLAYIRACEVCVTTAPCLLTREILAAQARLMHLEGTDLPVKAAYRCICKVLACVTSEHFRVAQQAMQCIKNPIIVAQVLIPNRPLLKMTSEALVKNRQHWHPTVREMAEEAFDSLLDYL